MEKSKEITRELKCDIVAIDQKDIFDSRKFKQMGDIGKYMEDQMLSTLAYVADTERKKTLERQKQGIETAKKAAAEILENDPRLEKTENAALSKNIQKLLEEAAV